MSTKAVEKVTKPQTQNLTIIIAVVAAVVAAGIFIIISTQGIGSSADVNYGDIPQSRTDDGGFVLGEPDAPITIVEFADFLCPHCQAYKPEIDQFIEEFVATGQAKFEYRFLPTQGDISVFAAGLAECADGLTENGFWLAHDILFNLAARGVRDDLGRELATELDIPYASLLECQATADQVETDQSLAQQVGVSGTPGVRVRYADGAIQEIQGYERGAPGIEIIRGIVLSAPGASGILGG